MPAWAKSLQDFISTNAWAWWCVPDIRATRGGTNRRTVVQASLRMKQNPISKKKEEKTQKGLAEWLKWENTCLASASLSMYTTPRTTKKIKLFSKKLFSKLYLLFPF
jgi:hypothetical protein